MAGNRKGGREEVRVTASKDTARVVRRNFPGPEGSSAPLRVHFARQAYADLTTHAGESVDAEVGGVLVGDVCEDAQGPFVDVRAVIRALAAREARAQITFTHETWTKIHAALDRDHAGLQIVGWYHTHPGFGVEFSAMDRFIQENFFSGPTQIAFLTDPLGGDTAVCFNGRGGIESLSKFWVDGRVYRARVAGARTSGESDGGTAGASDMRRDFERLEARINHLIQAVDEQRTNFHRLLMTVVVVACSAILGWLGYAIWSDRMDDLQPPRVQSYAPVPVKIGDETVMLGVAIVDWKVPPQLDAYLLKLAELELQQRAEKQEQLKKQLEQRRPPAEKKTR